LTFSIVISAGKPSALGAQAEFVIARKLRRETSLKFFGRLAPCVVAMVAYGSAHPWGRQLVAPGHEAKLIPPAHVKSYVRRNKTDAADAAAICEAAMRPHQRFVALRSIDNQVAVMRHRVRDQLVGQRTALLNALHGHLSKIGLVAAQGTQHAYRLKRMLADGAD
jgi:transposase